MARTGTRPTANKVNAQTLANPLNEKVPNTELNRIISKTNEPGLNDVWSSVVKFDDEYYPPEQTISTNTEYTIDATDAGTGNGRCDQIIASGTPTLTFTGFTIRKSDLTVTTNAVTLVDAHTYTILFVRRGSISEVYITDNANVVTPTPTLTTPTITATPGDTQVTLAITNEDAAQTGRVLLRNTTNDFGTASPVIGYDDSTNYTDTGLVNDTEYFYFFYNTASGYNNSATATDSATPSNATIILLEDDFTGTTIDTLKWSLANPDTTDIVLSQNDELIGTALGNGSTALFANRLLSQNSFNDSFISFAYYHGSYSAIGDSGWTPHIYIDNDNRIGFSPLSGSNPTPYAQRLAIVAGGTVEYFLDSDIAANDKRWKVDIDESNNISFYYWNVDTWTQAGTTQGPHDIGANKSIILPMGDGSADYINTIDQIRVTSAPYSTEFPI